MSGLHVAQLLALAWPPPPLLQAKVAAAPAAIGLNVLCVAEVVARRRRRVAPMELRRRSVRVLRAGLGIPFGTAALAIGLARFA